MDALDTLRRLRRASLDDAQRDLDRQLEAEACAKAAVVALDQAIAQETAIATAPTGDDVGVEAFAAWLRTANQKAATARTTLERRQSDTHRCRATLAGCRTALEIVETLQAERAAKRALVAERLRQRELDDIVSSRPGATGGGDHA